MMTLIRILLLFMATGLFSLALLLSILFFFIIDAEPHIKRNLAVTPEHIERAKQIVDQHRQQTQKTLLSTLRVRPDDLDIAANYLAKLIVNGKAQVRMTHQQADIHASVPFSSQLVKGYINFKATLIETKALPQLKSVHIGHFAIPDFISHFFVTQSIQWLQNHSKYRDGIDAIKLVQIAPDALKVQYQSHGKLSKTGNSFPILSQSEREKIKHYHMLLVQKSQKQVSPTFTQTLPQILQPLLQSAATRSANNSAIIENRAAILAATFYILDLPLTFLIPEAAHWPYSHDQIITLDGRRDFAQHFIVSAVITAYADTTLSDAIGLYKEIEDARSGSGFSFNDIAADRAGTRFGERATASQTEAVKLQLWASQELKDADLMPAWTDLPEHLPKAEFKRRYGNLDSPAYHQMMERIEQRVAALPFLQ